VLAAVEFYPIVLWATTHFALYKWVGVGIGAYFVLRLLPFVRKNEEFMQTFSHELTHTIVGLMFGRKIHAFRATSGEGGEMWHSGGRFGSTFISLAPYCFPIFTYAFLLLRIIGAWQMLMWFDIFIGFTLAFHIVCFSAQTRNYQTDISSQGYIKSYLFIVLFWLFNATVILLSIRKGIVHSATYLFPSYWEDIVEFWKYVF
jgi:cellulose synthase/poly-beta-1,6-N-acetylglucosamine synthase-like glycosyltransferase